MEIKALTSAREKPSYPYLIHHWNPEACSVAQAKVREFEIWSGNFL